MVLLKFLQSLIAAICITTFFCLLGIGWLWPIFAASGLLSFAGGVVYEVLAQGITEYFSPPEPEPEPVARY